MDLFILNIKALVATEETPQMAVLGTKMAQLNSIENAYLWIKNGKIEDFGKMEDFRLPDDLAVEVLDASGRLVLPCWCDSHTHLVYAGSREPEFVDRIKGLTYEEIAENGGGILNSAKRLQETSEDELFEQAQQRLWEIIGFGTGAVEIKSGYGLTVEAELKILRVIKRLKAVSPIPIKATFLGAHTYPTKYKKDHQGYLELIINEMLPKIEAEGLADYIDVFCEKGFFSPEETDQILKAGKTHGLIPKVHANQLSHSGGIQVGVANEARSVDHLEFTGVEEIKSLMTSETMPTILPSAAFFLNLPYAPARQMMAAGLPLALATDYNPGSTPSGRMPFVLSLACIKMRMTPEEAVNAATLNGAYAMNLEKTHGSICKGKQGNVFITKPISSLAFIPYSFGSDLVERVIVDGKVIVKK